MISLSTLNTPRDGAEDADKHRELLHSLRDGLVAAGSYNSRVHRAVQHIRHTRYLYDGMELDCLVLSDDGELVSLPDELPQAVARARRIREVLPFAVPTDLPPARCEAEIRFRSGITERIAALRFVGSVATAVLSGRSIPWDVRPMGAVFSEHEQWFLTDAELDPLSSGVIREAAHKAESTHAADELSWALETSPSEFCDRLEEVLCRHWMAVETKIHRLSDENLKHAEEMMMRYRALNWVITPDVAWDDVDLST